MKANDLSRILESLSPLMQSAAEADALPDGITADLCELSAYLSAEMRGLLGGAAARTSC